VRRSGARGESGDVEVAVASGIIPCKLRGEWSPGPCDAPASGRYPGRMTVRFHSPQRGGVAGDVALLDLLTEFIDAHADTVDLITREQPTELEWSAHCDYLRGLQRLGHKTLTGHDLRRPRPPLAFAVLTGSTRLSPAAGQPPSSSSAVPPARAAQALRPATDAQRVSPHSGVRAEHGAPIQRYTTTSYRALVMETLWRR